MILLPKKTYADTSCFRIVKDEHGGNLYEVAYITNYTAVQSNGAKKIVYIQQYNSSWTQSRIRHIQYYDESGKLITYSDAYSNWNWIKDGTVGATMRDKVKSLFLKHQYIQRNENQTDCILAHGNNASLRIM